MASIVQENVAIQTMERDVSLAVPVTRLCVTQHLAVKTKVRSSSHFLLHSCISKIINIISMMMMMMMMMMMTDLK